MNKIHFLTSFPYLPTSLSSQESSSQALSTQGQRLNLLRGCEGEGGGEEQGWYLGLEEEGPQLGL